MFQNETEHKSEHANYSSKPKTSSHWKLLREANVASATSVYIERVSVRGGKDMTYYFMFIKRRVESKQALSQIITVGKINYIRGIGNAIKI